MITKSTINYSIIPKHYNRLFLLQLSNFTIVWKIIFFMLVFGSSTVAWSLEPWKIAKESDGITISYRWLHFGEDRFREMKVEFQASALPKNFVPYLKESENYMRWAPGVAQCESRYSGNEWIMYTRMQTIWPFGQQDMVAEFKLETFQEGLNISLRSAPKEHQQIKDVSRLHPFYGSWELKKSGFNKTLVMYKMLSKTHPKVPRYLQDPVVRYALIQGMKRLRNCVEADFNM